MECLEKPVRNRFTRKKLEQIVISAPDVDVRDRILQTWDTVAKPLDGMGKFETLTAQVGAVLGTENIDISRKAVVIMCADNGIVEENVTQTGQEITARVAAAMGERTSCVGRMAKVVGAETIPVDIGINSMEKIDGVLDRKVRCGTRNFSKEPAMTEEEAIAAIAVGIDMVRDCKKDGYTILATGEMGIGNTTTSSAVTAALLHCDVSQVTGRGAGLSGEGLIHKQQVILEAIQKYDLYHKDALTVLKTVGGFDIAGLAGVCMGGAIYHVPIVLDGVISMVSALLAERILPGTKAYVLPSHKGKEPAVELLMKELGLEPVIDANLALGEGSGAVMMFSLLDIALGAYGNRTTFSELQMKPYRRFET